MHTWDDYSAQVLYYKRNTDTTAAVMGSRYHNILMVSGPLDSGITHSSTTAVFQPGDKAGRPALTCTDDTVSLSYQDPACSFTFTREAQGERRYLLTHGQKGGITCTLDPDEGILRVNGRLVWQTEPITLELFNISLFPVTEAEVLQLNRAYALLNDASGFWHEADFRNEKTTLPVYSWMDTQSFRAAKGKAAASLKDLVWVMATVDNWALIEYEVSSRTHRTGWVDWTRLTRVAPVMLTSVPAAGAAWMTDDPFVSQYQIKQGNELKDIQLLACLAPFYAYALAVTEEGQRIGGFVPLKGLAFPAGTADPAAAEQLVGTWRFVSGGELTAETLVLNADGTGLLYDAGAEAVPCTWTAEKNAVADRSAAMLTILQEDGTAERFNIYSLGHVEETGRTELTLTCGEAGGTWARAEEEDGQ